MVSPSLVMIWLEKPAGVASSSTIWQGSRRVCRRGRSRCHNRARSPPGIRFGLHTGRRRSPADSGFVRRRATRRHHDPLTVRQSNPVHRLPVLRAICHVSRAPASASTHVRHRCRRCGVGSVRSADVAGAVACFFREFEHCGEILIRPRRSGNAAVGGLRAR